MFFSSFQNANITTDKHKSYKKKSEQLWGHLSDQEGAALEVTGKLFPALNLPSSPFVPPPHHCRQVAAVSKLLDVGSLYKGLLCSLPPGPLDRLSHWIW